MEVHNELKAFARELLTEKRCDSIKEEYGVVVEGKRWTVDVAGFSGSKRIAVECNYKHSAPEVKIAALRRVFDEVIELTVEDLIQHLKEKTAILEKDVITFRRAPQISPSESIVIKDIPVPPSLLESGAPLAWLNE